MKSWWFKHYIISRGKLRWCQKTMLRKRFDWGTNIEEEAKFWQRDLICNIGRCVHQHKSGPSRSSLLVLWPQHHAQGQRHKKGSSDKTGIFSQYLQKFSRTNNYFHNLATGFFQRQLKAFWQRSLVNNVIALPKAANLRNSASSQFLSQQLAIQ